MGRGKRRTFSWISPLTKTLLAPYKFAVPTEFNIIPLIDWARMNVCVVRGKWISVIRALILCVLALNVFKLSLKNILRVRIGWIRTVRTVLFRHLSHLSSLIFALTSSLRTKRERNRGANRKNGHGKIEEEPAKIDFKDQRKKKKEK